MDRSNNKLKMLYKCITTNTSAIWQHAAHTTDQLTSPSCLTGAIQKCLSLNEKYWKNFLGKVQQNWPAGRKKDKTEKVLRLGRRTREEIVKWNKMTALRFQTGGRHQTSPASLRGDIRHARPPFGETSDISGLPSGRHQTSPAPFGETREEGRV